MNNYNNYSVCVCMECVMAVALYPEVRYLGEWGIMRGKREGLGERMRERQRVGGSEWSGRSPDASQLPEREHERERESDGALPYHLLLEWISPHTQTRTHIQHTHTRAQPHIHAHTHLFDHLLAFDCSCSGYRLYVCDP